jgi:predicted enzyme related to lactoylglutathione lyase
MPTRDAAPVGAPCWVDLMTSDTDRARSFYCDLFGWTAEEPNAEYGGYFNFLRDGARTAGCMSRMPDAPADMPDAWSVYLATDDARKTIDVAAANGGQVMVPAMDVGDLGTMGVVMDAGGAAIGLWQPNTFPGITVLSEHGAPSWFELFTRDYEAALTFYRDVFRWETHTEGDTDEFRYTTLTIEDQQYAGVMDAGAFLPDGVPAHWSVYFGVDDADAALARVGDLGGSTVQPAQDTPYGRLAIATDPTGAQFKLIAPNDAMPAK